MELLNLILKEVSAKEPLNLILKEVSAKEPLNPFLKYFLYGNSYTQL